MGIAARVSSSPALPERTTFRPMNFDMLAGLLNSYDALGYPTIRQTLNGEVEEIGLNFSGLAHGGFRRNGIIFTCMATRQLLLSEARFQFQELRNGVPGDLYGTKDLALLENPWPNATTSDLVSRAVQDVDLAGNFFAARRVRRIRRMRPDWVAIILGSENEADTVAEDIDAEVVGYAYYPGGYSSGVDPIVLLPAEVAHWAPIPDPEAGYRGISWIEAVRREITGDSAARDHKLKFFENGATPNMVVSLNLDDPDKFKRLVEHMDSEYKGISNAYKTLYLAAGATATPVGTNFQELDLKGITGAGEVRIINASGMHAVIIGASEGLQGSSLNQGNFTAARRLVADKTLRPLWGSLAGALQSIIPTPGGSRLWYDDRHIPFLADDVKDAAEVQAQQSSAIRQLVDAGFEAASVIDAITAGDFKRLNHSGLMSVQLLPPGTTADTNGTNGTAPEVPVESSDGRMMELARFALAQQRSLPVTFEEGAFRIETPVTVESPQIHFPEGFVRSETTVEPAQVTIEKGAVQVDSPVTVEPAQLTIADGAIRSETTVEPTHVTIEEGAVRIDSPITVEPAQLTIEEGAIRSETPVTVNTPDVTIEEGAVRVDSPVTVEPAQVTVEAPVIPEQRSRTVRKDVTHDTKGRITKIIETEE